MRKVELRMNELFKFNIIKDVAYKRTSITRASALLNCAVRNIYKLLKLFETKGKVGFIHGNRNKKTSITLPIELSNEIITFYSNKYLDANFKHFKELLEKINIFISYNALHKILTKEGFVSPKCHRITMRNKNKEIKQNLENKDKLTTPELNLIATTNLQNPSNLRF